MFISVDALAAISRSFKRQMRFELELSGVVLVVEVGVAWVNLAIILKRIQL